MKFFHRIRNKLMLAFLVVTLIPALVVGIYFIQSSTKLLLEKELDSQAQEIETIKNNATTFLSSAKADVLILSNKPTMIRMLASKLKSQNIIKNASVENEEATKNNRTYDQLRYEELRRELEKEFLNFSKARAIYHQVRYLDETGMEIIRIDSSGIDKSTGQAISSIRAQSKMKSKAGRYYFDDSVSLLPGEVFVSPLDLNREGGKIEVPYKPVIRYATPLFYPDTVKRAGVVITNIDAKALLTKLGKTQLIGEDGSYFNHADNAKLWGGKRDLDTGENLNQDEPIVAKTILTKPRGVISSSGEDLLSFDKSTEIYTALTNLDSKVMTYTKFDVPGATPAQSWVFLTTKPIGDLLSSLSDFLKTFAIILGAVLLFSFLLAFIMGSLITKPITYLTEMAEKVSKGDLDNPIIVDDKGEIGHLATAFERMRISMVKSLERLKKRRAK